MTHGAKKWWVIFWNDGPKHSWHLGSMLYLHTDTDTCMHIFILADDYTVKPVLSGHSKKKTNYRLMQVKSITECSKGSILQSFRPSLSYHLLLRSLFCLFLSGRLRQVLLYWQPTCIFCRFTVRWTFLLSKIFSQLKRMGPLGPLPWKVMGHILKSWDNDPGPP